MVFRKQSDNPTPVYYRLQTEIRQKIENAEWRPKECIPPERRLAEIYKVSVGTVKKAILNLVHEGYLYRVQGKGTFVSGTTLRPESLRYYRLKRHFSDAESNLKVRLLGLREITARQPNKRYLKLRANQNLYEVQRLFSTKNQPVIYTVSYLPCKLFADLEKLPTSLFEKVTLYEILEKNYGIPTIYNHELFRAVSADERIAARLETTPGRPLLFIEMQSFTYKDKPYEYRESYCLPAERGIFREI
jgi:GntR family transcriptional regulator